MRKIISCNRKKRFDLLKNFKVKPVLMYAMIGSVVFIGLSYLIFVNKVATDGYQVKELSEKIEDLRYENKKLELETSEIKSLQKVSDRSQDLQLVKIDKMDYVTSTTSTVAYK